MPQAAIEPMLKTYIVLFKFKNPGDKAFGPVRQFRINANNLDEAKRLTAQYSRYPNIEIVQIRAV